MQSTFSVQLAGKCQVHSSALSKVPWCLAKFPSHVFRNCFFEPEENDMAKVKQVHVCHIRCLFAG